MKFFTTFLVAVGLLVSQVVYAQGVALSANAKADITAALKAVDPTNAEAVTKVVADAIEKSPSMAPQIVALAVEVIGQALVNNPTAAANVIPAFVLAAAKNSPQLQSAILTAAINAVPDPLQSPVIPKIVGDMVANAGDPKAKAEVMNTAKSAVGDNPAMLSQLDQIAKANSLSVSNADGADAVRYFVDNQQEADAFFTGVQSPTNVGSMGGFGGSGGGSGTSSSSSSNNDEPPPAS